MAAMVSVSVVIPCYNVEQYIERAIQSIVAQQYSVLEIICVDNGSTDKTVSIIQQLMSTEPRLQLLHESRKGASFARNTGTEQAKGEYIQYLDADDELLPDKLSKQLQQEPLADLLIGAYSRQDEQGNLLPAHLPEENIWLGLMLGKLGITTANLWRKQAVIAVGGWNVEMKSSQEYDLMFRLLKNGVSTAVTKEINSVITVRQGSISTTNRSANLLRYLNLRAAIYQYLKSQHPQILQATKQAFDQALFTAIRMAYPDHRQAANAVFELHLGKSFKPIADAVTGAGYCKLYRFLGFRMTEAVRGILRK